jgi:hypothetical protein
MSDKTAQATAQKVANLVEQTLTLLMSEIAPWPPEFRILVLNAVAQRARLLAIEEERGVLQ